MRVVVAVDPVVVNVARSEAGERVNVVVEVPVARSWVSVVGSETVPVFVHVESTGLNENVDLRLLDGEDDGDIE